MQGHEAAASALNLQQLGLGLKLCRQHESCHRALGNTFFPRPTFGRTNTIRRR